MQVCQNGLTNYCSLVQTKQIGRANMATALPRLHLSELRSCSVAHIEVVSD